MNAKHTATPWQVNINSEKDVWIGSIDDDLIVEDVNANNALHIVRCVNSFDLLLTQLNDIISSKTHEEAINYAKKMVQQMQERC